MEINNNMKEKIESTFNALDSIKEVQVSPFFKDKTMQKIFSEKKETTYVWSWFTPKVQLATLVCIVILNVVAFSQLEQDSYNEDIYEFAESYGFSVTDDTSFIN